MLKRAHVAPRTVAALLVLIASPLGLGEGSAQVPNDLVDRVVAVVGDSAVLQSDVEEQLDLLSLQDPSTPQPGTSEYTALFRDALEQRVDVLLQLQAAARDSLIEADEAAADQQMADFIDRLTRQAGSQAALQQQLFQALGMSLPEFREMRRQQLLQDQLIQRFQARALQNERAAEVSETEMLEYFNRVSGQVGQRPRTLTFERVEVRPLPADSAKEIARAEAQAVIDRLRSGEDFADVAREVSEDPGSAAMGGDVGWFRRGQGFVKEFEDVAFALPPGGTSGIVETRFGFHVIKVERKVRTVEVQARHILIRPTLTAADVEEARDLARQIEVRVRAGESVEAIADEIEGRSTYEAGEVPFEQLGQLPPAYGALRSAVSGAVYGPLEIQQPSGEPFDVTFDVVHVTNVREAGAFTFEDMRGRIAAELERDKRMQRILDRLRRNTHVEIRM